MVQVQSIIDVNVDDTGSADVDKTDPVGTNTSWLHIATNLIKRLPPIRRLGFSCVLYSFCTTKDPHLRNDINPLELQSSERTRNHTLMICLVHTNHT